MTHPSDTTPTNAKTTVRRADDPDLGRVWLITYGCGCDARRFRTYGIALRFATHHRCPEPWPALFARKLRGRRWY